MQTRTGISELSKLGKANDDQTSKDRNAWRPGWFRLYHDVIDECGSRMKPHRLAIYVAICHHANKLGEAWPSYGTLAKETGMCRQSAIDAVKWLVAEGLVEKRCRKNAAGEYTSNIYVAVHLAPDRGRGMRERPPSAPRRLRVVCDRDWDGTSPGPKQQAMKHTQPNNMDTNNTPADVDQAYGLLKHFGVTEPIRSEIATKRGLAWVEAAIEQMDEPGGVVWLYQRDWQPPKNKASSWAIVHERSAYAPPVTDRRTGEVRSGTTI